MRSLIRVMAVLAWILAAPALVAEARISVVTTTPDLADIARNVGGDRVDVRSIARGHQDPHFVEPRPSYLAMLRTADLFVQMGVGLEAGWAPFLLENSRNPRIMRGRRGFVDASVGVPLIRDPGDSVDPLMWDSHRLGNPHYHLDPANVKIIARNIVEGLKRVDPAHSSSFEANLGSYVKRLSRASHDWAALAARLRGRKFVSYHPTWTCFARRFGLVPVGQVQPRSRSLLLYPTPDDGHLAELVRLMRKEGVRLIVIEPYVPRGAVESLARETGASVVVLAPSVTDEAGTATYLDLVTQDLRRLREAVEGSPAP